MGELVGNRSRIGEYVALEDLEGKIGRKKLQYGTFLDLKYLFAVLEAALPAEERSCNVFTHITLKEKMAVWLLGYKWLLRSRSESEGKYLNGPLNVPGNLKWIKALNEHCVHVYMYFFTLQITEKYILF